MTRSRYLLTSCLFLGLSCAALSADTDAPARLLVQWDNDVFAGSDRDYTNGARIAYIQDLDPDQSTHSFFQNTFYNLTGADEDAFLGDYRYNSNSPNRYSWGIGVTQLMFTPEEPSSLTAPKGERPYAGWLGLEFSFHAKNEESATSVTLSLGTTGKNSYAEDAQKWIHENVTDSDVYQGWDSQLPGEMTVNLHLDHKNRIDWLSATKDWPIEFDGYTEWGTALGNLRTDAYLGGLLRAGFNLPATYTTPRVQIGSYGHALFKEQSGDSPFSLFMFAGARGSAVLHDITLDGPVFRDFDTGVNREPLVAEFLAGIGMRWKNCDLSLSRTIRTDEFENQNENQEFGSILFRFQLPW